MSARKANPLFVALVLLGAVAAPSTAGSAAAVERAAPGRSSYIVTYKDSAPVGAVTRRLEEDVEFRSDLRFRHALKGFSAELSAAEVAEIAEDPAVEAIVHDGRVRATEILVNGDVVPPGVRRLGLSDGAELPGPATAPVAVLDTGVDLDHPDLNVTHGFNCIEGNAAADDDNGHGTHVAGTIGALNNGLGVVGVAPGTSIRAVKVLEASGDGTWSQIICGIDWVTGTRADDDPTNDIAVANMSLAGQGDPIRSCASTTDPLHQAICRSAEAGVTYVVAAGNDAWDFDYPDVPDIPAAYPEVLTVTAFADGDGLPGGTGAALLCDGGETDDTYASFSNFAETEAGKAHTIAAPGVCIRSTFPNGGYGTMSGTSMAAPHVAGVAALCIGDESSGPGPCAGRSPGEIVDLLRAEAERATASSPRGFKGDPADPVPLEYYGFAVSLPGQNAEAPSRIASRSPARTAILAGSVPRLRSQTSTVPLPAMLREDDGTQFEVASKRTRPRRVAWEATFRNVPEDASDLEVIYRGRSSKRCSASVGLRNHERSRWTKIAAWEVRRSERKAIFGAPGSEARFVDGRGRVVVKLTCARPTAFVTRTDLLQLRYVRGARL